MTIKTAAEYLAEAQRHRNDKAESWERSDTDGFLSQWASGRLEAEANWNAHVVEHGAQALILLDLDGKVISVTTYDGEYGTGYRLTDEAAARFGRRIVFPSNAMSRERQIKTDAAKGYRREWVVTRSIEEDEHGKLVADRDALLDGDFELRRDTDNW